MNLYTIVAKNREILWDATTNEKIVAACGLLQGIMVYIVEKIKVLLYKIVLCLFSFLKVRVVYVRSKLKIN